MPAVICGVAVSAATYAIDKLYDYRAPALLADQIKVGCRVLVPFGKGNKKTEGIVLSIRPNDLSGRTIKPVTEVLDEEPVLDASMLRLAAWMREHLYATYFDCIRIMLPAGLWFKRNETYSLVRRPEAAEEETLRKEGLWPLFSLFLDSTPARTLEETRVLMGGRSTQGQLEELCRRGFLHYESNITQRVQDKTEKMFRLAIDPADAFHQADRRGRSPVQTEVVSCLRDGISMSQKELVYMTGVSDGVLRTMCKNGILFSYRQECLRTPDYSHVPHEEAAALSQEQQRVYEGLHALLEENSPRAALLYGVTGSGKTEVYLHLIADTLQAGKSALLLVPEIGLTPQLQKALAARFGEKVAVLHSGLSAGERYDSWKKIRSGQATVVAGTRSAVFAPVDHLGLIILDEEQDAAYKSEQSPRYHARDVAKYRVYQQNALLVMGSATPSVETTYGAKQGKYPIFRLAERFQGTGLPQVRIADMRGLSRKGYTGSVGPVLLEEMEQNLERGEQTILFLNRRGNSRVVGCAMCGWVPECPSCSTTMTYHSVNGRVMCHYCGASQKLAENCPNCGSIHLFMEAPGTQRVEEELHEIIPKARVLRMDADTTAAKNAHERMLETFGKHRADILLGTQMVTKGLDFENVTLVGVLDADQSLYAQDYRAQERTFALITQVVGRAGRREKTGRAIIQTFSPNHPVILDAARQDYDRFYESEIQRRQALLCPPIEQLILLSASGIFEKQVLEAMIRLKFRIQGLMQGQFSDFQYPVLGPAAASMLRVAGRYRYHLTIRCPDSKRGRQLIAGLLREFAADSRNRGVSLFADVNPDM